MEFKGLSGGILNTLSNLPLLGVLVLSWYPPGKAENQGYPSDDLVPLFLDTANKYKVKVPFTILPI